MDKCQRILWLVVFATLMSAISGFFLRSQEQQQLQTKVGFADTPFKPLLLPRRQRQARDVDSTHDDCARYGWCMRGTRKLQLISQLAMFRYSHLASGLSELCTEPESLHCDLGRCTDGRILGYIQGINDIVGLACNNTGQFEAGMACWGSAPFTMRTSSCPNLFDRTRIGPGGMEPVMACMMADAAEDLPDCSQQDLRLLASVSNALLQVVRS